VVLLAPTEGEWSCVSNGSPRINSVFVFVGVVLGQGLSIYHFLSLDGFCFDAFVYWGLAQSALCGDFLKHVYCILFWCTFLYVVLYCMCICTCTLQCTGRNKSTYKLKGNMLQVH
jgi:hypothetical protein